MFGEKVTPNHHALARQFTLFDNFYCSGVLSADGHSWINEAYVTDYLEKLFGGFTRSYPYEGSDPLAFAPRLFVGQRPGAQENIPQLSANSARPAYSPAKATWSDVYADFKNGTSKVKINVKPNMATLSRSRIRTIPGFPLTTPDVYRAKLFIGRIRDFEKKGDFAEPDLCLLAHAIIPTAPARVRQRPRRWSPTTIWRWAGSSRRFRKASSGRRHASSSSRTIRRTASTTSTAIARWPWSSALTPDGNFVDSTNYNQTGMVKTIELILGLPPMNQLDLSATPMRGCFQDSPT